MQWKYLRDKQIQVDMAILDFSKAFDTVPHKRLLGKLSFYMVLRDQFSERKKILDSYSKLCFTWEKFSKTVLKGWNNIVNIVIV